MKKLIKVAVNDFKLVFRDNSLKFFFIFPLLNLLVVRFGLPFVVKNIEVLKDYLPIILMFMANQGSLIFGFIYSMVLIDEKDTNVAKVYGILPVSQFWFVIFRLIAPFLLATSSTFLIFLVEPYFGLSIAVNLLYSALAGLIAPVMVLFVAIMAKNKIEGMTWQKLFNIPITLPVLAFFVPAAFSFIFAFLPTHWAYQGFNNLVNGKSYFLYLLVGFVFNGLVIILLARKFSKTHFQ
jgi:fluoroquinolone transport system permease protein